MHVCFLAANVCLFVSGGSGDDTRRVHGSSQLETAQPKEEQRPLLDLPWRILRISQKEGRILFFVFMREIQCMYSTKCTALTFLNNELTWIFCRDLF